MKAVVCEGVSLISEGQAILQKLTFSIDEGSVTGLLGAEGSGKTCLIKLLCGLYPPGEGSLEVAGYSPAHRPEKVHSLSGVVTPGARLYESMNAMENMVFFGRINGLGGKEARERASYLMHLFGVWEVGEEPLYRLDSDIRAKLSIARALMGKPRLLLLDEPTKGFDSRSALETDEAVRAVAREEGITVLLASRDPEDLLSCDSYVILEAGQILATGDLKALQKRTGLKDRAVLKVLSGDLTVVEMRKLSETCYEKEIETIREMAELVKKSVLWGAEVIEATVQKPTLSDVYRALLDPMIP